MLDLRLCRNLAVANIGSPFDHLLHGSEESILGEDIIDVSVVGGLKLEATSKT